MCVGVSALTHLTLTRLLNSQHLHRVHGHRLTKLERSTHQRLVAQLLQQRGVVVPQQRPDGDVPLLSLDGLQIRRDISLLENFA